MNLSELYREKLFDALKDGYRSYDTLRVMVRIKLGLKLENITNERNDLESIILDLIQWAESNDKVLEFIWEANEKNSDNRQIKQITYQLCSMTKQQYKSLCDLLQKVDLVLLENAFQEIRKSENTNFYPRFISLKYLEKVETFLKESLIKELEQRCNKPEESYKKNPLILEFVDCLRRMPDKEIDIIRNALKEWVDNVKSQLNLTLDLDRQNDPTAKIESDDYTENKDIQNQLKSENNVYVTKVIELPGEDSPGKDPGVKENESEKSETNQEKLLSELLDLLEDWLKKEYWKEADRKTTEIMQKVAGKTPGEDWEKDDIMNFPIDVLDEINRMWKKYTNGNFGFSIQASIWQNCKEDEKNFIEKVGWHDERILSWEYEEFRKKVNKKHTGILPTPPPFKNSFSQKAKLMTELAIKIQECPSYSSNPEID